MTDTKVPKKLLKLIEKWMNNKKTGSLQIKFIKGEISYEEILKIRRESI